MKKGRKLLALMLSVCCVLFALPGVSVLADQTGEKVVSLGADLSAEQKTTMRKYFGIEGQEIRTLTVTNADERAYLSDFVSLEEIGTRTYSCALVKPTTSGGIQVKTANLTYVTSNMIASTLSTCGVENCQVLAAAPFAVSGTGALTGIIMAYEASSGRTLDQKRVRAATRELVTTARLGRRFGPPRATLLVNQVKIQVIQNRPTKVEEITNVINNVSIENNISLSEEETVLLIELFQDISDLEFDTEEIEEMQQNLDRVEESVLVEIEQEAETEEEEDILMNTDDSALGEDATFDTTEVMTLDLPRVEAEMEEASQEETEEVPEEAIGLTEEEEPEEVIGLTEEEEPEEVIGLTEEEESEPIGTEETEAEAETDSDTENILLNTDDSVLGDSVPIDLSLPEDDQDEEIEKTNTETETAYAVPADPSAFLPEAETEEGEESDFLVFGETLLEDETADTAAENENAEGASDELFDGIYLEGQAEENNSAEENAENADSDDIFDLIFEDGQEAEDSSAEKDAEEENPDDIFDAIFGDEQEAQDSSAEADAEEWNSDAVFDAIFEDEQAAEDDFAEAADTANDAFDEIYEGDEDSFYGEQWTDEEDFDEDSYDSSSSSFSASSLSFSPNGSSVDPGLTTLTISCSTGTLSAGSGSLTLYTSDGDQVESVSMSDGSRVSLSSGSAAVSIGSVLSSDTSYYVVLSSDALERDGVPLEASSSSSWTFHTSGSESSGEEENGEEPEDAELSDDNWDDDWDDSWDW